jgi:hypothetical protein
VDTTEKPANTPKGKAAPHRPARSPRKALRTQPV